MWEARERVRAEVLAAVDIAEAEPARGEGRPITWHFMEDLAAAISERGRARMAVEQTARR